MDHTSPSFTSMRRPEPGRLSDNFLCEVQDYFDLLGLPPQFRSITIQQRLAWTDFSGNKNSEHDIREFLLRQYSRALQMMKAQVDDYSEDEFTCLLTLKQEIERVQARIPRLRGCKLSNFIQEVRRIPLTP